MKIKKLKEKIVDNYAIKNEDGTYLVKINEFNQEVYDFGENAEKVDEELKEVLESEIEIDKCISMSNIDDNIEIEPINLKYLISKQIIKK
jgi:predicted RNase H-like HicB family nuclease